MQNLEFLPWKDFRKVLLTSRTFTIWPTGDSREPEQVLPLPLRTIVIMGRAQDFTEISVSIDGIQYYQGPASSRGVDTSRGHELATIEIPLMINGTVSVQISVIQGVIVWVGHNANYGGDIIETVVSPTAVWGLRRKGPNLRELEVVPLTISVDDRSVLQDRRLMSFQDFQDRYGINSYHDNFLYAIAVPTEENFAPIVHTDAKQDPKQNLTIDGVAHVASNPFGEFPVAVSRGQTAVCQIDIPTPVMGW